MANNRQDTGELSMQETRRLYNQYRPLFLMFREDIRNIIKEEQCKSLDTLFTRIKNFIKYGD